MSSKSIGAGTIRWSCSEHLGEAEQAVRDGAEDLIAGLLHHDRQRRVPDTNLAADEIDHRSRLAAGAMLAAARPGAAPDALASNRAVLETRIANWIGRGVPIAAQMLWSPKKHWVVGPDSDVDIAELAALNTLLNVHNSVRPIHDPGLKFTFYMEDVEFEFMEGEDPELEEARNRYFNGLRGIVHALGLEDVFAFLKMSDKSLDAQERRDWFAQMQDNYDALERYWYESERNGITQYETYESYQALQRLGWRGSIPEEMRNHYLRRLTTVKERPRPEKVSMILRNFAGMLLHYQKNLLTRGHGAPPIKFSFIPPAPGAPADMLGGRIDLRFVSRKICSRVGTAGPWSTKGHFRQRAGRITPTFASWHQPVEPQSRFVRGDLTLVRDGREAVVRADVLIES